MPADATAKEVEAARALMHHVVSDADAGHGRVITPLETSSASAELDDELADLARTVLPGPMQAMGPSHLAKAGRVIAARIDAGWPPEQITAVLESRELPHHVRNLVALVLARLRDDVPANQPPPRVAGTGPAVWSHRLPDGRVITRRDLDAGALARDFHLAVRQGTWQSGDRWAFAIAAGVERYLISR